MFVDSLLELKPLDEAQIEQIAPRAADQAPTQALLSGVSSLLSDVTRFVGVVTVPKREEFPFRHIDFVALDGNRLLVILVFTDGEVQNRVITSQQAYSPANSSRPRISSTPTMPACAWTRSASACCAKCSETSARLNQLMLAAARRDPAGLSEPPDGSDMLVAGQTNLMGSQELSDMDRLRELFEAFQRKRDLLQLLESCARAEGVRLFIGEESGFDGAGRLQRGHGALRRRRARARACSA